MKLLFICGSLEPGRDGVGDYTRRLAAECIRQGVGCRIIALNDRHLQASEPLYERQQDGETSVECLRLASAMPWARRVDIARGWRESYDPDILSLQFVAYSFHRKGVPVKLLNGLRKIGDNAPWHVMFHELWVGASTDSSPMHRFLGNIQRRLVQSLLKSIKPVTVSTHSTAYACLLQSVGCDKVQLLPLFGNIPVADISDDEKEPMLRTLIGASWYLSPPSRFYVGVVFGSVHPEWNVLENAKALSALATRSGKEAALVFLGRNGLGLGQQDALKDIVKGLCEVAFLGEQPGSIISNVFMTADIGFATSPRRLIEKSGSAIAMREHGLPVVVSRDDWQLRTKGLIAQTVEGWLSLQHLQDSTHDCISRGRLATNSVALKTRTFLGQIGRGLANQ